MTEDDIRLGNYLADKLRTGEARMDKLDRSVEDLKTDMAQVKSDLSTILDLLVTMKAGIKILGYLGVVVKWLGYIAAGLTAIYVFYEKLIK